MRAILISFFLILSASGFYFIQKRYDPKFKDLWAFCHLRIAAFISKKFMKGCVATFLCAGVLVFCWTKAGVQQYLFASSQVFNDSLSKIRPLRFLGDDVLREVCQPVKKISADVVSFAEELVQTMKANKGLGLAAPQIGGHVRMFAIQVANGADKEGRPILDSSIVLINPVITKFFGEEVLMGEGCLSIPGVGDYVVRKSMINIEYTDLRGDRIVEEGVTGWRSRCMQHEYDHLNGILFIDHLSDRARQKHEKILNQLIINTKNSLQVK